MGTPGKGNGHGLVTLQHLCLLRALKKLHVCEWEMDGGGKRLSAQAGYEVLIVIYFMADLP